MRRLARGCVGRCGCQRITRSEAGPPDQHDHVAGECSGRVTAHTKSLRGQYASSVTRDMRRFLAARFLVMLGWVVLFVAGLAVGIFIGDRISNAHLRWAVGWGFLLASVRLGLRIQSRVLARIDPDGRLRGEFAKLGTGGGGRVAARATAAPAAESRRGANPSCGRAGGLTGREDQGGCGASRSRERHRT